MADRQHSKKQDDQEACGASSSNMRENDKSPRTNTATTYKSDGNAAKCLTQINEMRKNDIFCDVKLVVDNKEISAHKMVLAAASPYFYAMFSSSSFAEAHQDKVKIGDVDYEALRLLVEYVYNSCIELTEDNVQSCLNAANLLQFTEVIDWCCDFLESHRSVSNCLSIRDTFDAFGFINLVKPADAYIRRHFDEIIQHEEFLHLGHQRVADLLNWDRLIVKSEEHLYESILAWIRFDLDNRQRYVAEVMANVRFPTMQKEYLAENVRKEPLMKNNSKCADLIYEAEILQELIDPACANAFPRARPRVCWRPALMLIDSCTTSVKLYDLGDGCLDQRTAMPIPRYSCTSAFLNGTAYVIGGSYRADSKRSAAVDMYDPTTDTWSPSRSMQVVRILPGVAVINGRIYVIGSKNVFSDPSTCCTAEFYDPTADCWTFIAPIPTSEQMYGVGVINGEIYVVAGIERICCLRLNMVHRYNPGKNSWTRVANVGKSRIDPGVGALNNVLYVIGGKELDCGEKYDPETDTWSPIASMMYSRQSPSIVAHNGLLYAVGGMEPLHNRFIDTIEVYCPERDCWECLPWKISFEDRFVSNIILIQKPHYP